MTSSASLIVKSMNKSHVHITNRYKTPTIVFEMAENTGSILDSIFEKTANIESNSNANNVKDTVLDILRTTAHKELKLRENTITMRRNDSMDHNKLIEIIDQWSEQHKQLPPTAWQDKERSYFQFDSIETKEALLCLLNGKAEFKELVVKYSGEGEYFRRKPVRVEINNVRSNIKLDRIKEILTLATGSDKTIMDLREGKPHAITRNRSIMFKVLAEEVVTLFDTLDGEITYSNKGEEKRIKLRMRINVKPWQCKDCYAFGLHKCEGKKCANCGAKDHQSKECRAKTKWCSNCKKKGHKARDTHCSTYLNEVAKEIRKIDIPSNFLESPSMRNRLYKTLQFK